MTDGRFSQTAVRSITEGNTARLSELALRAVYNFPSEAGQISQLTLRSLTVPVNSARASQLIVRAVIRGRSYNPQMRAWSYTQDGHDFYVLRLGDDRTLVYDLSTEQWSWFSSGEDTFWRPQIGMNWYTPGLVPAFYGSNVVCGDDSYGHLWVLDPESGLDDNPADTTGTPLRFPRVATGQVPARKRAFLPVDQVYLTASAGRPVASGDEVTLSYSDDLGVTYVNAGAIPVTEVDYQQEFSWRSLGPISQAGRLFQISDEGAFARIDGLDCDIRGAE